jgi:hypothetical protein
MRLRVIRVNKRRLSRSGTQTANSGHMRFPAILPADTGMTDIRQI